MRTRTVIILEEAAEDLEAGRSFYDEREPGVGHYFLVGSFPTWSRYGCMRVSTRSIMDSIAFSRAGSHSPSTMM